MDARTEVCNELLVSLAVRRFIVVLYLNRKNLAGTSRRISDANRPFCPDNVYFANLFKFRIFTFEEAVKSFRETMHPTMYNEPNAPVHAFVELDMTTDKKVSRLRFTVN